VPTGQRASGPKAVLAISGDLAAKLKDTAEDQALNAVAVVKEGWAGFLRTDRFFKYRALIVASWLGLAAVGLVIAWPEEGIHTTRIGARLVMGEDPQHPVYMLMNESDEPWTQVLVIANGQWRAAADRVEPGKELAVTPKQLVGKDGAAAPADLHLTDLELRTHKGRAVLMRKGELQ
jgi:hypothetical protein